MVKLLALCALVLTFTLGFTNDISNQTPEDQDGSGDDEEDFFSGDGSGISLVQETNQSKPESTKAMLTSVSSLASTTVSQSTVSEIQNTSELVTMPPAEDFLEEKVLAESEAMHKSNTTTAQETSSVLTTQVNPTLATSTVSETKSTQSIPEDVEHHSDQSATAVTDATDHTTNEILSEVDLTEDHLLPKGGVPISTTMTVTGDTGPINTTKVPENEFGSGVDSTDGDFTFNETVNDISSNLVETDQTDVRAAKPDTDGTTDASKGIMDRKEVLAGVIAGGVVGLLFAVFLVGFMLYRMKKKDEGSYSLEEPKQSNGGYQKPHKQEEFYA